MSRLGRIAALTVTLLLFGVAVLLPFLPSGSSTLEGSSLSRGPWGRDIALGLLGELGFRARPFTSAPGELPDGGGLLVLESPPPTPPGLEAASEHSGRLRDPEHYRRFVESGGTLLTSTGAGMRTFLEETLGVDVPEPEAIQTIAPEAEPGEPLETAKLAAVLPDGEQLELGWIPRERFPAPSPIDAFTPALADEAGRPLALRFEDPNWNGGSVLVFVESLSFLDNGKIQDADDALLLVRIAEELPEGGPVLFDEYVLGGWRPPSPLRLAFGRTAFPFSFHLALLGLVLLVRLAWVRAFPRDPEPIQGVSALERARGSAGLFGRAGRWNLLAASLRRGVIQRLGVNRLSEADPRASYGEEEACDLCERLFPEAEPEERARWTALLRFVPADRASFFGFGDELARLETADSRGSVPGPDSLNQPT